MDAIIVIALVIAWLVSVTVLFVVRARRQRRQLRQQMIRYILDGMINRDVQ